MQEKITRTRQPNTIPITIRTSMQVFESENTIRFQNNSFVIVWNVDHGFDTIRAKLGSWINGDKILMLRLFFLKFPRSKINQYVCDWMIVNCLINTPLLNISYNYMKTSPMRVSAIQFRHWEGYPIRYINKIMNIISIQKKKS